MSLEVHIEKLAVYDGKTQRCGLDTAYVNVVYPDSTSRFEYTDSDGVLTDSVGAGDSHATCTVSVSKPGYKAVKVKTKITWDGDHGDVGLVAVHLMPD